MVRKIIFVLLALMTVGAIAFTVCLGIGCVQEYARVAALPGSTSGVDYLAAHLLKGEAAFFGVVSFVLALITAALGCSAQWKKKEKQTTGELNF